MRIISIMYVMKIVKILALTNKDLYYENKQLIKDGYISERKHPECDYFIYNYTQKTQYEQFWNEL